MSSASVNTVTPEATMTEAAEQMAEYRIRRLVVIAPNGGLAGIITSGDLARTLAKKQGYKEITLNALARYKTGPTGGPYQ